MVKRRRVGNGSKVVAEADDWKIWDEDVKEIWGWQPAHVPLKGTNYDTLCAHGNDSFDTEIQIWHTVHPHTVICKSFEWQDWHQRPYG